MEKVRGLRGEQPQLANRPFAAASGARGWIDERILELQQQQSGDEQPGSSRPQGTQSRALARADRHGRTNDRRLPDEEP